MQSGSFVNLSRQRKEQAAARALQEQQAAAAAAAAAEQEQHTPAAAIGPTLSLDQAGFGQQQQQYSQQSPYHAPQSTSSYLGATGSAGSSVASSPLVSPPPGGGVAPGSSSYLGSSSLSPGPGDPPLTSPHDYSGYSTSTANGSSVPGGGPSIASTLVRRHHTVGSRPQKYLSATQKERLDEEDSSRAGFDDGASTGAIEGSFDGHGGPFAGVHGLGAGGLARAGSLPSKPSASYIQSSGSISRSQGVQRRPSLGANRLDTIPASGMLYPGSPPPDGRGSGQDDDVEWERALAQSRMGGHLSDLGHDFRYAPSAGSRLQSHRSLQFPPGSYHPPAGYSEWPTSPPLTGSTSMHQRSNSGISDSHLYAPASSDPGVRRVQSLNQGPVNVRLTDRLAVVAPGSSRSDDFHGGLVSNASLSRQNSASRLKASELPPPISPTKAGPWTSSVSPLPPGVRQSRTWAAPGASTADDDFGGPLSPVPQAGGPSWRAGVSSLEAAFQGPPVGNYYDGQQAAQRGPAPMSQEEMQNAFDAMTLGRSVGPSSVYAPSPQSLHGGQLQGNGQHAPMLHPPSIRSQSRSSSRGPSRNNNRSPALAPPRFASPGYGPSSPDVDLTPPFAGPSLGPPSDFMPNGASSHDRSQGGASAAAVKLSLLTDSSILGEGPQRPAGPVSASAFVPPIGHTSSGPQPSQPGGSSYGGGLPPREAATFEKPLTASGTGWEQKHALMGGSVGRPYGQSQQHFDAALAAQAQAIFAAQAGRPQQMPQYMQSLGSATGFLRSTGLLQPGSAPDPALINQLAALRSGGGPMPGGPAPHMPSQSDLNALIQAKGYNPTTFDTSPAQARFFVIKSFTEDDVAKSLKFEIWSSTTFGNKRLDLAFKESAADMPIYLFFSVNSSGRFAGMAQMLTDVDYNTTSTVWAQDKWKGVFRLKWIYIKDIPNGALRHIRLTNTPEQKPVTNSRDTQELPLEGGVEMLRIFHAYQPRTTLLQDFSFYESLEQQKSLQQHAEAARQPTAHLPPFPGQQTVPSQQRPPSAGQTDGHNSGPPPRGDFGGGGVGYQQAQRDGLPRGGGGRGYSGPSPPQARY